jgi:nucleoside-diphosphate-sugar epimerase
MKVVITGAGGFVGRALVTRLLEDAGSLSEAPLTRLSLVDIKLDGLPPDPRVRLITGELSDASIIDGALVGGVDIVFHLAAVPPRKRIWRLAARSTSTRLSPWSMRLPERALRPGSSSPPMPGHVDDATLPHPTMSYGAQKLMLEAFLSDASPRGLIDARCVRLPGIVARPRQPSGHLSAFLGDVFHVLRAGERFTCLRGLKAHQAQQVSRCHGRAPAIGQLTACHVEKYCNGQGQKAEEGKNPVPGGLVDVVHE